MWRHELPANFINSAIKAISHYKGGLFVIGHASDEGTFFLYKMQKRLNVRPPQNILDVFTELFTRLVSEQLEY